MSRRIMRDFIIDEISGVDRPAQAHAKVALLKRAGAPGEEDDNKRKDIDMDPKELEKKINDAVTKAVEPLKTENDGLKAKLEKAEKIAALSDAEKSHMASLKTDAEKDEFLGKSADARKAEIAKRNQDDEVLTVDGNTIRKSDNPGLFAIVKSQQADIEKQRDDLAKAREDAEVATFTKVAETEYGTLPGENLAKGSALRAVSKLGKADREAVETMLKAGEKAMQDMAKAKGKDGGGSAGDSAAERLEKAVDKFATENKISKRAEAYDKFLATPAGRELYDETRKERNAA